MEDFNNKIIDLWDNNLDIFKKNDLSLLIPGSIPDNVSCNFLVIGLNPSFSEVMGSKLRIKIDDEKISLPSDFDKENLLQDTKEYYSNIFNKIKQKKDTILSSFGIFFAFGMFITIARFGLYIFPVKFEIIYKALYFIFLSIINNSLSVQGFLYYMAILFLEAFNITLTLVFISKKLFSRLFEKEFNLKIKG